MVYIWLGRVVADAPHAGAACQTKDIQKAKRIAKDWKDKP